MAGIAGGYPTILVDDLDALACMPETQRAIGRGLSHLAARNVQVVVTSTRPPHALVEFAEAMTGNEWHLNAQLLPCDDELMVSLVRRWMANLDTALRPRLPERRTSWPEPCSARGPETSESAWLAAADRSGGRLVA